MAEYHGVICRCHTCKTQGHTPEERKYLQNNWATRRYVLYDFKGWSAIIDTHMTWGNQELTPESDAVVAYWQYGLKILPWQDRQAVALEKRLN